MTTIITTTIKKRILDISGILGGLVIIVSVVSYFSALSSKADANTEELKLKMSSKEVVLLINNMVAADENYKFYCNKRLDKLEALMTKQQDINANQQVTNERLYNLSEKYFENEGKVEDKIDFFAEEFIEYKNYYKNKNK